MTLVEQLAVAKAMSSKGVSAARAQVKPGTHPVDVVVRIHGDVEVGEDTNKTSTSALISEDVLILALWFSGCTRERAAEIIEQVTTQALQTWTGSDEDKKAAKAAREAMVAQYDAEGVIRERLAAVKARLPKTSVAGSVRFNGTIEEVL